MTQDIYTLLHNQFTQLDDSLKESLPEGDTSTPFYDYQRKIDRANLDKATFALPQSDPVTQMALNPASDDVTAPYSPSLAQKGQKLVKQVKTDQIRNELTQTVKDANGLEHNGLSASEFQLTGLNENTLRSMGVLKKGEVLEGTDIFNKGLPLEGRYVYITKPSHQATEIESNLMGDQGGVMANLNKNIVEFANQPILKIKGIQLSAPDIVGLGMTGFGMYEGGRQAWNMLVDAGLSRAFDQEAAKAGQTFTDVEKQSFINGVKNGMDVSTPEGIENFKPSKLTTSKIAVKGLYDSFFNKTPQGTFITQEGEQAVNKATTSLVQQNFGKLTNITNKSPLTPGLSVTSPEAGRVMNLNPQIAVAQTLAKSQPSMPDSTSVQGKASYVVDSDNKIAKVVKWQGENPVVIYPGKTGGIKPGTANEGGQKPYEYALTDKWRTASADDFSQQIRPSKSQTMLDLRQWRDDFIKQVRTQAAPKIKQSLDDASKASRRRVIEARLSRGEPVPDKLLAEFPDLQTPVQPSPQPPNTVEKISTKDLIAEINRRNVFGPEIKAPQPVQQPVQSATAPINEPVSTNPPTQPPALPATPPVQPPTSGTIPPGPPAQPPVPSPVPQPSGLQDNVIGLRNIEPGLTRSEILSNIIKNTVNKPVQKLGGNGLVTANEYANPAMNERTRVQTAINSNANVLGTKADALIRSAFELDKQGRIPSLAGIVIDIPGAPTIQDVAARYPLYEPHLNQAQKDVLNKLNSLVSPYRDLLKQVGIEVNSRPDVIEGGFYLPRGRTALEGADEPIKVKGGTTRGNKKGFEKTALFNSQSEGIDKGYEYAPIGQVLTAYAKDAGVRAADAHVVNYFKSLTDETGKLIGETPKMRMLRQNPDIASKMDSLKSELLRLQSLGDRLTQRQIDALTRLVNDPEFNDIDEVRDVLNETVTRGKSKGADLTDINAGVDTIKQQINDLRPEYKAALQRAQATPREQGRIGLNGLQATTYPDEISNAANEILKKQGPTTGTLSGAVNTANALNNLYRGLRATLDDSAVGIQGLLGLGGNPKAYYQALKVNAQAWMNHGDTILGKFLNDFDEKNATWGRLTSSDWAKAGLHFGGATSEFQLGKSGTSFNDLPGVRQANRAFGYFGDALRLEWADNQLATELKKRTLPEIEESGDLNKIANVVNNMTGWTPGKAFGSIGDLVLFAPKWFQSQLETVVKAGGGFRPNAPVDQKMARNTLLKFIGGGVLLTILANKILGQDTDYRPIVDGKRNSDFMRIKFQGNSYSLFGSWDSLLGMFINIGTGHVSNAMRDKSSGLVSMAWDLISGKDYNWNKVRDNPADFAKWLLSSMIPFSAGSMGGGIKQTVTGQTQGSNQEPDFMTRLGGAVNVGTQFFGIKSYQMNALDETTKQWNADLKEYFNIPTDPIELKSKNIQYTRDKYRELHPDVDAKLFISGKTSAVKTASAMTQVLKIINENGIDPLQINSVQTWLDDQKKRKEAGVPDTNITVTDRLMQNLTKATTDNSATTPAPVSNPATTTTSQPDPLNTWNSIRTAGGSSFVSALNRVWYNNGALNDTEATQLKKIFNQYPLGQTDFNTWYKRTLRQLFENLVKDGKLK